MGAAMAAADLTEGWPGGHWLLGLPSPTKSALANSLWAGPSFLGSVLLLASLKKNIYPEGTASEWNWSTGDYFQPICAHYCSAGVIHVGSHRSDPWNLEKTVSDVSRVTFALPWDFSCTIKYLLGGGANPFCFESFRTSRESYDVWMAWKQSKL